MAVITKFFIIRDGVELDKVFTDKKEAEAFDKMLDAADKLTEIIRQAELPEKLSEKTIQEVAICLAKKAPDVVLALKGVKFAVAKPSPSEKPESGKAEPQPDAVEKQTAVPQKRPGRKTKAKPKAK